MGWTETRFNTMSAKAVMENRLKEAYGAKESSEGMVFTNSAGVAFHLHAMGQEEPWDFIVIEYLDTGEDGDGFYPKDYTSEDEMFAAMVAEIEG